MNIKDLENIDKTIQIIVDDVNLYDEFVFELDKFGYMWLSTDKLTELNYLDLYNEKVLQILILNNKIVTRSYTQVNIKEEIKAKDTYFISDFVIKINLENLILD